MGKGLMTEPGYAYSFDKVSFRLKSESAKFRRFVWYLKITGGYWCIRCSGRMCRDQETNTASLIERKDLVPEWGFRLTASYNKLDHGTGLQRVKQIVMMNGNGKLAGLRRVRMGLRRDARMP